MPNKLYLFHVWSSEAFLMLVGFSSNLHSLRVLYLIAVNIVKQ